MSLKQCGGRLFLPSLLLVALNLAGNEASVVPKTFCSLRKCVGVFNYQDVLYK